MSLSSNSVGQSGRNSVRFNIQSATARGQSQIAADCLSLQLSVIMACALDFGPFHFVAFYILPMGRQATVDAFCKDAKEKARPSSQ